VRTRVLTHLCFISRAADEDRARLRGALCVVRLSFVLAASIPMPKSIASSNSHIARGRWLIFCAACLWSLAGVFIKFLDLPPLTIVFYRSFFAALVFTSFLRPNDCQIDRPILISVVSYTAAISAFVSANKLTTAANAIVLQYTAPIFVFLFSRLVLGEKISRLNWLALVVSMMGVGIISLDSAGEPEMAGVLLALLSGVLFATYMVNLRRTQEVNPVYLTWINNIACALLLLSLVKSQLALSFNEMLLLAIMGAVQLGLPYFLFSKGLQTVSLQEASLIALVEPVLNPLWVALAVGEIPSVATLAGGGMILAGLGARYVWPLLRRPADAARAVS
jgi:drug/metabolite transporter (DMT)-like permease